MSNFIGCLVAAIIAFNLGMRFERWDKQHGAEVGARWGKAVRNFLDGDSDE